MHTRFNLEVNINADMSGVFFALIILVNKECELLVFSFICSTGVAKCGKVFLASLPTQLLSSQQDNPHATFIVSRQERVAGTSTKPT